MKTLNVLGSFIAFLLIGNANAQQVPDFDNLKHVFCSGGRGGGSCSSTDYLGYNCSLDRLKDGTITENAVQTGSERWCDGFGCPANSFNPIFNSGTLFLESDENRRPEDKNSIHRGINPVASSLVEEMNTQGKIVSIENLLPNSPRFAAIIRKFGGTQQSGMVGGEIGQVTLIKVYHIVDDRKISEDEPTVAPPELVIRFYRGTEQVGGSVLERPKASVPSKTRIRVCTQIK